MKRTPKEVVMVPVIDMVAAAVVAFKANGNKIEKYDYSGIPATEERPATPAVVSNKSRINALLANTSLIPTEAREEAEVIIHYIQNQVMMSVLTGKFISPFMRDVAKALEEQNIPAFQSGLIAYTANIYHTGLARDSIVEQTTERMYTSQALGKVGDKIAVNFTMLESRYLQQYDCFSAYGTDDKGNLVSFLTKHDYLCKSQRITGKVKNAANDKWHNNAMVTALNFVKAA